MEAPHIVIGSGPAGVACAQALLEAGCTVLMLDVGEKLEPERASFVEGLSKVAPLGWPRDAVAKMQDNVESTAHGLPVKLLFGSDFCYRPPKAETPVNFDGIGLTPSYALGGLSNVWGSAMLPYLERDTADWPIRQADLTPHYRAAVKLTGITGANDALADLFPLHTNEIASLRLSKGMSNFVGNMSRRREALNRASIFAGRSRLAVRAKARPGDAGCEDCGQCMTGCPYGHIFCSAIWVEEWKKTQPNFRYEPRVLVEKVVDSEAGVRVFARQADTGAPLSFDGARAYVAAGVVATTKILLHSLQIYDRPVAIQDSQYFLAPWFYPAGGGEGAGRDFNTLAQAFLEIMDPAVSPYAVHTQIYDTNFLVEQALAGMFFNLVPRSLIRAVSSRLIIMQGFIHSEHSSRLLLKVEAPKGDGLPVASMSAEVNPEAARVFRKVLMKLLRIAPTLRAIPGLPAAHLAKPGRSFHCGGSFPMSESRGEFESDLLGRVAGFSRVHAVDSTVLPSIPGTTITLGVMANAHRIAATAANLSS